MFGPGMLEAINAAGTVRELMDRQEDFIYTVDEIATEKAYQYGWRQDEAGDWTDEYDEPSDHPLNELFGHNLPHELQEEIVDACVEAYNEEYGPTPDEEAEA